MYNSANFVEKCNISSKEIKEGEQNTKVENEHMLTNIVSTFEILERIENSVVCAITKTHEKNQDEIIIKLKSDLQNERDKKEDLKEISGKIDEIKSAISTTCISMKSGETCNSISEGYEKISTKTTNQIKDFTEKLNRNITETISQTLQSKIDPFIDNMRKISENSVSFTKSLERTGAVLSDNRVTNREITKTLQNLAKLNYSDMKQHPRELGSVDEMFQNTEASYTPNMQVTNRYLPLAERIPNPHSEEKRVTNNQHIHDNEVTKKALILSNSHIRYIRTDNFLQSCVVHKYTSYSMSEMEDKLQELDTDYDSIFFHVFTNNIRAETSEVFIRKFESFCQKLRNHCQFAKLIISLPFFSVNDQNLNQKISQCNVLLQYIF